MAERKDVKYRFGIEVTMIEPSMLLGKVLASHNNVSAEMCITKAMKIGEEIRPAAMQTAYKLLQLADDFIHSATAQDEPSGPTGPDMRNKDG